ncbi:probable LRR receptor-like serine/threonine-protein kinase At1g67720 [Oryza glaberrima]|uniref:probable LRR receptor-like serine/threonine-protein kinase At1g67720 n=1 Tax=Oryza glaberrima TaxID=4538 RepID=UPI00224BF28F|nr:probable LRR receptor-like serine/threonine-protein kinase At1g67720 [Oryza glaberrima]
MMAPLCCCLLRARRLLFFFFFFFAVAVVLFSSVSVAQIPGFQSIDCGGSGNYTDEVGLEWTGDEAYVGGGAGATASISSMSGQGRRPYRTVRYFPADGRKYCYRVSVKARTRYLVRASFLYGNFDGSRVFPEFDLYVGASRWSTIVIYDESKVVTREMVALAQSGPSLSVCLANATTGHPFISTLELRPLNASLYHTAFEAAFFLSLAARINFGAPTADPVRYPDDPYDRVWESDMARRPNFLVDAAPGTIRVATDNPVFVASGERPPQKVMQTAVVGTLGALTYRLDLNGFPGSGWACSYLAEIEDDAAATARRFKLYIPGLAEVSKPTVDIGENAPGKYRVYQPGYDNISLPFVLPFAFRKTDDSARGPILNAMEIYSYIPILPASPDAVAMDALAARYQQQQHSWAREGGDPCVPAPWSWLTCTSSRVIAINLSGNNLTGAIPPELAALPCLQEIRLDNNMLTGPIPDLSACTNLTVIHLENNQLEGSVPSYLSGLPKLSELYLENNRLSGVIPRALLSRTIVFKYSGNKHLRVGKQEEEERNVIIGICALMGIGLLLAAALCYAYNVRVSGRKQLQGASAGGNSKSKSIVVSAEQKKKATPVAAGGGGGIDNMMAAMAARGPLEFEVRELEEATSKFARKIGSGGFGVVYYGRLGDGREIAVKVASSNESIQGKKQLANEVALLSRIHHRNLVAFLGYCWERDSSSYMLVYEYMHNGSLKEQLQMMSMSWLRRLQVAEDAAKGIEYLHCGCTPAIIHRDIKTSNILLDAHMRAKVSDLGLSKSNKATNSTTNTITTHVRGTLGYLDPHYYVSQQLTHKSDLYSFGIILLELISGRPPILLTPGAGAMASLGPWAKSHYESGDIEAIVDPSLRGRYRDVHSVWKVAETAVRCIDADPRGRPSMPEVVKDIQEAIALEMPSSESERPAASFFSPGAGAAGARSSATVRSHDLVMDNLMYDSSFCDSLNLPRTPR